MKQLSLLLFCILLSLNLNAQLDLSPNVQKYVAVSNTTIIFSNAMVYDGTGKAPVQGMDITIKNGIISNITAHGKTKIPEGAKVMDMTGKTITPGFIMLHEHMFYPTLADDFYNIGQMSYTFPKLYLAGGVTTIRTAGSIEPFSDLNLKKWVEQGKIVGPNIYATGPFINRDTGAPILAMDFIKSPEDASALVNEWANKGATSFKAYMHVTREDLKAVINTAHAHNQPVTGHLCSVTYREAADLGIDNLEHGFLASTDLVEDKPLDRCKVVEGRRSLLAADKDDAEVEALMQHLIDKNVTITSTLAVFEPYTGREIIPGDGLEAIVPSLREKIMLNWSRNQNKDSDAIALFKKEMYWEKKFHDMGGKLVVGTDPTFGGRTVPGYANQRTIELLKEAGFPTEVAIQIASANGAKMLGIDKETGTIEVGKKADLNVLEGDLSKDISVIRNTLYVFKDGIGYDSKKLFESVSGQVGLH